MSHAAIPLTDLGNAPKFYVSGLARITPMGPVALFSFYVVRPHAEGCEQDNVIEVELIAPVDAVGPAFDMALEVLGARALMTLAGHAISKTVKGVLPM